MRNRARGVRALWRRGLRVNRAIRCGASKIFTTAFSLVRWLPGSFQCPAHPVADLGHSDLAAFCCIMRLTEKEPRS